jgi:hypothetical protein
LLPIFRRLKMLVRGNKAGINLTSIHSTSLVLVLIIFPGISLQATSSYSMLIGTRARTTFLSSLSILVGGSTSPRCQTYFFFSSSRFFTAAEMKLGYQSVASSVETVQAFQRRNKWESIQNTKAAYIADRWLAAGWL